MLDRLNVSAIQMYLQVLPPFTTALILFKRHGARGGEMLNVLAKMGDRDPCHAASGTEGL